MCMSKVNSQYLALLSFAFCGAFAQAFVIHIPILQIWSFCDLRVSIHVSTSQYMSVRVSTCQYVSVPVSKVSVKCQYMSVPIFTVICAIIAILNPFTIV